MKKKNKNKHSFDVDMMSVADLNAQEKRDLTKYGIKAKYLGPGSSGITGRESLLTNGSFSYRKIKQKGQS